MLRRLSRVVPVLLTAACATGRAAAPPQDAMSRGLAALDRHGWGEAQAALNEVARRCESGPSGVDALLLLATTALDPANAGRNPSAAARYAAHVIRMPDVDALRLRLAEGLYLAARDAGGEAPPESRRTAPGAATRYSACDQEEAPPVTPRGLPAFEGTTLAAQLEAARSRADSLSTVVDSVGAATDRVVVVRGGGATGGTAEADALRERVRALEAELDRIRRLLRKGGG